MGRPLTTREEGEAGLETTNTLLLKHGWPQRATHTGLPCCSVAFHSPIPSTRPEIPQALRAARFLARLSLLMSTSVTPKLL
jgi:hypothetical protein